MMRNDLKLITNLNKSQNIIVYYENTYETIVNAINPVFLHIPFDSGPVQKGAREEGTGPGARVGTMRPGPEAEWVGPTDGGNPFCLVQNQTGSGKNTGFIAFAVFSPVFS